MRTTADNLEAELQRVLQGELKLTSSGKPLADYEIIGQAIRQARFYADRPSQLPIDGKDRWLGRLWREAKSWWTGSDVDESWRALHRASQALLMVEADALVKSQLAGVAAAVVTALSPGDIRDKGYLKTLGSFRYPPWTLSVSKIGISCGPFALIVTALSMRRMAMLVPSAIPWFRLALSWPLFWWRWP